MMRDLHQTRRSQALTTYLLHLSRLSLRNHAQNDGSLHIYYVASEMRDARRMLRRNPTPSISSRHSHLKSQP